MSVFDYWGNHLNVRQGFNHFDAIEYFYFLDPNLRCTVLAHDYDYREEYNSKEWAIGYDPAIVHPKMITKANLLHQELQGMQAFVFNLRKPLFKDIAIREAISMAFDYHWVNKHLFYNQYVRNDSFFKLPSRCFRYSHKMNWMLFCRTKHYHLRFFTSLFH